MLRVLTPGQAGGAEELMATVLTQKPQPKEELSL
ncbi:hypothetical protein FBALC1_16682 [Flavobacteriales bacterium ALC-1]|nr:hypothetical protein FBALC1_16682 [Flavobacteriales bacterium ALC-1]